MSRKVRSQEEVEEILRAFANGESISEVCKRFELTESSFYRILKSSRGEDPHSKRKQESKIAKLEKQLNERNREIHILKSILKKT
jgi:transposase-like protein